MALYEFLCEQDGPFEVMRPLGSAPPSLGCPRCGGDARRVFSSAVLLTGRRRAWTSAIERADKSRHEPEVVRSPPPAIGGPRRSVAMTPALRRLPRP